MDSIKELEARFLRRDNVLSRFVVFVICICYTCGIMYTWCYVTVVICTCHVVYTLCQ